MSDDHECSRCGKIVHVPDGRDFGDGDMCWDCTIETQAAEITRLTAALAEKHGIILKLRDETGDLRHGIRQQHDDAKSAIAEWEKSLAERDKLLRDAAAEIDRQAAEIERLKMVEGALEGPAKFGWQCYQDRCENAYIEASVVKKLEAENASLRQQLESLRPKAVDTTGVGE